MCLLKVQPASNKAIERARVKRLQDRKVLFSYFFSSQAAIQKWSSLCASVFIAMSCCAICGLVCIDPFDPLPCKDLECGYPPYGVTNAFMASATESGNPSKAYYTCSKCMLHPPTDSPYTVLPCKFAIPHITSVTYLQQALCT